MINIYEVSILDLLPPNLKQDPDMIAASKAVDNDFLLVANEVKECILLPRIDDISDSDVIDLLAWQMHVDFYDYLLPLSKKIELVKNSTRWHRIKGTPQAVIEVITSIFGDTKLQEWFEYDGDPYFFTVDIDIVKEVLTKENLKRVFELINAYKNKRSWLEILRLHLHSNSTGYAYVASTLISTVKYILTSDFDTDYNSNSSEILATTTVNTNKYTLTSDINLNYNSSNNTKAGSIVIDSKKYELTNDITEETESVSNENQASSQSISLYYELS